MSGWPANFPQVEIGVGLERRCRTGSQIVEHRGCLAAESSDELPSLLDNAAQGALSWCALPQALGKVSNGQGHYPYDHWKTRRQHLTTILADMSSQDALAAAVEANMAGQFAYFGRSPRAHIDDSPGLLRFLSGIPIPEYNGVIRAHLAPESATDGVQRRIQAVVASFSTLLQPFFWWVGPTSTPSNLGGHLTAAGLTHLGDGPGMAADLHALDERGERPPGLSIIPVTDERTLRDWVEVAGAGYGEPASIRQARYDVHMDLGLGADLALQRYVAYLGGRPVAMSALFLGAGVAGVYEVATAKDARRQGIGAAVTLAPLYRARELGYHIGVLQASEMGTGVYTRLGFRKVCSFSLYAWEPPL